jgi:hypothetical protein
MNFQKETDRRSEHRISFQLPVVVSGENENGEIWREETKTINVSTRGVRFYLTNKVRADEQLLMRASFPDGSAPLFMIKIIHIIAEDAHSYQIGVEVLDRTEEWENLFLLWASDVRDY